MSTQFVSTHFRYSKPGHVSTHAVKRLIETSSSRGRGPAHDLPLRVSCKRLLQHSLAKMQSTVVAAHSPAHLPKLPGSAVGHNARAYVRFEGVCGDRISLVGVRSKEVWRGLEWRSRGCGSGPVERGKRNEVRIRAAAETEGEAEDEEAVKKSKKARTLQLAAMFGIWYLLNIYFNIYNKQVLKVFPFPATFTAFQFGCGTVIVLLMWAFNLHPKPKFSRSQLAGILALAVVHTTGNVLTNISLGKVSVSFTHTIKALEPFFTVVLSALFLGLRPSPWVVSSLLPIVGGVALASLTEASFNWIGFCSAMASNVTNQSRNVFSKKLMGNKEESLDNINLFSVITIISFVLLVPTAIFIEGIRFTPSYIQSAVGKDMSFRELCIRSLLAGICFHSYQQVSYMILQMVSPVTHAVGNCLKRVVVIISSVLFFQTPVSPLNSLGTGIALAGVFLYSRAKSIKAKQKSV